MRYNKELCIKLKEAKIDDQNLWLSAANLTSASHLKNYFRYRKVLLFLLH